MADVIAALYRKRANLLTEKKAIQLAADIKIQQVENEVKNIDKALETLNAALKDYLCPHCSGTGIVRKCDAAGQMEDWPCSKCNGTGVVPGGDGNGI